MKLSSEADVCLILEGTYPYVSGGVANWTHELIQRQSDLSFHVLCLMPKGNGNELKFDLPDNVIGMTTIYLQDLPSGGGVGKQRMQSLLDALHPSLSALHQKDISLETFQDIYDLLAPHRTHLGQKDLLDSPAAWELMATMYEEEFSESSFLDYFWSWRALLGGMYSVLLADLPRAKTYHALCTGYAGLMAARAKLETGRPVVLTEHGIYTNERRVEIASVDWLEETASHNLSIDATRRDLRELWTDTFASYSRIAYAATDNLITLYSGNQDAQLHDGANPDKMRVIPNGVDVERFAAISRHKHDRPTVALVGRVVPIKDIKSFIRAMAILKQQLPDLNAYIMGSIDEDPEYYEECRHMVEQMALQDNISFTGQVQVDDYFTHIDVLAISSISEAQPLVILEGGACGIPTVATNVGACREMIMGKPDEENGIGAGGAVTPLANPTALAENIYKLLSDEKLYETCSENARKRVATYYNKDDMHAAYHELYQTLIAA